MTTPTTSFGVGANDISLTWWFPWLDISLAPPFTADTKTFTLSSSAAFLDVMPASPRSFQLANVNTILRFSEGIDVTPTIYSLTSSVKFIEHDRFYVPATKFTFVGIHAVFRITSASGSLGGAGSVGSGSLLGGWGGGYVGLNRTRAGSTGSDFASANTDPTRSRKYVYDQNADSIHTIGPWPTGINNRLQDSSMPVTAVRDAVNVTLDSSGFFRRRDGYSRVSVGAGFRGGYSCAAGAFVIRGSSLYRFNSNGVLTKVADGVVGPTPAYTYFNGAVYFTDGIKALVIENDVARQWGIAPPTQIDNVDFSWAQAGTYLVAHTYVDAAGRESGASDVRQVVVNSSGTGDPVVYQLAGVNTYVSPVNSSTLYLDGYGAELVTKDIGPAPAGQVLTNYRGRLYVASGNTLWASEPFAPDWFHKIRGFMQFPEPISICLAVDKGLYVVSDQAYFLRGSGPEDFALEPGLPYRGIHGTGMPVPFTQDVMWFSERGLIIGSTDGNMQNVQEQNVVPHQARGGAIMLQEQGGQRHAVVSLHLEG